MGRFLLLLWLSLFNFDHMRPDSMISVFANFINDFRGIKSAQFSRDKKWFRDIKKLYPQPSVESNVRKANPLFSPVWFIFISTWNKRLPWDCTEFTLDIKWGVSSRWSLSPKSACGSIETATTGTRHPSVDFWTYPGYFSIEFFFEVIDHWFFGCVWTNSTNENLVNL